MTQTSLSPSSLAEPADLPPEEPYFQRMIISIAREDLSAALARLNQYADPSPPEAAAIFEHVLSRMEGSSCHPKAAPALATRLIEMSAFEGLAPGELSPCPFEALLSRAPGGSLDRSDPDPLAPTPYRANPALWGLWIIQLASKTRLEDRHRDAIFDALLALPHPKPLRDALEAGVARLPPEAELVRRFDHALERLMALAESSDPRAPAAAQAPAYACDRLAALGVKPSDLPAERASVALQAASLFGCGRGAIQAILPLPERAGVLTEALLSACADVSSVSPAPAQPGPQPGRALGALFSSPAWTPEGRQAKAFELCAVACKSKDAALFNVVCPHCDWSALSPHIRQAFGASYLAAREKEAFQSKKVSGQADPDAAPRPKRSAARL